MSARARHGARAAKDEQLVGHQADALFLAGVDPASGEDSTVIVEFRGGRVVNVYGYDGPRAVPDTVPAPPPDFEDEGVACGDACPRAEGRVVDARGAR